MPTRESILWPKRTSIWRMAAMRRPEEEILLDALKTDPTRTAIHVKLLEIYAGRKNNKQFETLASDLYARSAVSVGDWEKAAAMGLKLDPANPLYGGGTAGDKPSCTY